MEGLFDMTGAPPNTICDFWLSEESDKRRRYEQRHKRDGLCLECKRKAWPGANYCWQHIVAIKQRNAKYQAAMAARKILSPHSAQVEA